MKVVKKIGICNSNEKAINVGLVIAGLIGALTIVIGIIVCLKWKKLKKFCWTKREIAAYQWNIHNEEQYFDSVSYHGSDDEINIL